MAFIVFLFLFRHSKYASNTSYNVIIVFTINIHYTIVAVGIGLIIVVQVPIAVVLIPVCIPSVVGRTDPHY